MVWVGGIVCMLKMLVIKKLRIFVSKNRAKGKCL